MPVTINEFNDRLLCGKVTKGQTTLCQNEWTVSLFIPLKTKKEATTMATIIPFRVAKKASCSLMSRVSVTNCSPKWSSHVN